MGYVAIALRGNVTYPTYLVQWPRMFSTFYRTKHVTGLVKAAFLPTPSRMTSSFPALGSRGQVTQCHTTNWLVVALGG